MRSALITGITGQDSVYLAKLLLSKNYKVYGTFRRASTPNFWRLLSLGLEDKIELIPMDLTDMSSIINALQVSQPTEVYNMAASSYVADSFECPQANVDITGNAVLRLLEAIRIVNWNIKFYQSSSSEMYGNHVDMQLGAHYEDSIMEPISPYGIAKLAGHRLVDTYRKAYEIHAVSGILFNHESPLRGLDFVTRKITNTVAKIKLGLCKNLTLGNVFVKRDWGYAPEYMEMVWRMMQEDEPQDYVIGTDYSHSVMEFAQEAMKVADIDVAVNTSKAFTRPLDIKFLQSYSTKARETLGWKPKTMFGKLVKIMVDADIQRWTDWQAGKTFPWDAPLYPNEAKVLRRCK